MTNKQAFFIILIIIFVAIIAALTIDHQLKESTWKPKIITGEINEIILYNTFPNEELFITFTSGEFLVVTKNYMGTYAILSQLPSNSNVRIDYYENGHHKIYVKDIEVIE